ncbi:hypothetical protein V2G26_003013 [Clonostachys chloroleuca]
MSPFKNSLAHLLLETPAPPGSGIGSGRLSYTAIHRAWSYENYADTVDDNRVISDLSCDAPNLDLLCPLNTAVLGDFSVPIKFTNISDWITYFILDCSQERPSFQLLAQITKIIVG